MNANASAPESGRTPRKQDHSALILAGMMCIALLLGILTRYVRANMSAPRSRQSDDAVWTEPDSYDGVGSGESDPQSNSPSVPDTEERPDKASGEPVDERLYERPSTGNPFLDFINGCADWDFEIEDFQSFDKQKYLYAINAIYAHAGRRFGDRNKELRDFYEQFDWYQPTIDGSDFRESYLNGHEVTNLYRLLDYAVRAGYRSVSEEDKQLNAFIASCETAYFDISDLSKMDADMTFLAWNAVYAKAGWKFESEYLRAFFSRFDWYQPKYSPENFHEGLLNEYQKFNRALVRRYDEEKEYVHAYGEVEQYERFRL